MSLEGKEKLDDLILVPTPEAAITATKHIQEREKSLLHLFIKQRAPTKPGWVPYIAVSCQLLTLYSPHEGLPERCTQYVQTTEM